MEPAIDALGLDQPQVVMLNGGEEDNNSFLFRDGYAETVEARVDAGDWALVDDQFVPGWDNAEAQTIMEQILVSREQQGRRGVRRQRRSRPIDHQRGRGRGVRSDPDERPGRDGRGDPERRPRQPDGERLQADPGRGGGHGRDRARAARTARTTRSAATRYTSALASGGSTVAIIGINAADGTPADSATGDGVVPYVALVPIGVTIDNIMDTVIADGFRTIEEICTGDIAQTDFCQENAA